MKLARESANIFTVSSFDASSEYILCPALMNAREAITTVYPMGLALGKGDQSQQLNWSFGLASWSFTINNADGTEAPEWIQINTGNQIVVEDDEEIATGYYEFQVIGAPTDECYATETSQYEVYFILEVYSFTAGSVEDIEYEIHEPVQTQTYEFTQFNSTYNSFGIQYSIRLAGSDIAAPDWITTAGNRISIGTNNTADAGEYRFVLVADLNDRAYYP